MKEQEVQNRLLQDLDSLHLADVVEIKQFVHNYIGERLRGNAYESIRNPNNVLEEKEVS